VIREARALLSDDANFLSSEVDLVYRQAYKECLEIITGKTTRGKAFVSWSPDATADRKFLGIPEEEDIDARLGEYAEHVYKARKAFQEIAGHRD
jgi:hypothetical protein